MMADSGGQVAESEPDAERGEELANVASRAWAEAAQETFRADGPTSSMAEVVLTRDLWARWPLRGNYVEREVRVPKLTTLLILETDDGASVSVPRRYVLDATGEVVDPRETDGPTYLALDEAMAWAAIDMLDDGGARALADEMYEWAYGRPATPHKLQSTGTPDWHTHLNSKITRKSFGVDFGAELARIEPTASLEVRTAVDVRGEECRAKRGKWSRPVKAYVAVGSQIDVGREEPVRLEPLTAWDLVVHDAACSFWLAGKVRFTARQIHEWIVAKGTHSNAKGVAATERSLQKLRYTPIYIDADEEFDAYGTARVGAIESTLLVLERLSMTQPDGSVVLGYEITQEPALLKHDSALKQLVTVPHARVKQASMGSAMTTRAICVREYLLSRIAQMCNQHNRMRSNRITYQSLCQHAGLGERPTKKQRESVIRTAGEVLDELCRHDRGTGEQYVRGWEEYADPRTGRPAGVQLRL